MRFSTLFQASAIALAILCAPMAASAADVETAKADWEALTLEQKTVALEEILADMTSKAWISGEHKAAELVSKIDEALPKEGDYKVSDVVCGVLGNCTK